MALPQSFEPISNAVHLSIDMQNLFALGGIWKTPWMERVLPVIVGIAELNPPRTVFTRFITPLRVEDRPGRWQRYFTKWDCATRFRLSSSQLEIVSPLSRLIPPATVIDKPAYSTFTESGLTAFLRDKSVDTLIITGSETDVCVLATVLDAVDLGFRVAAYVYAAGGAGKSTTDLAWDGQTSIFENGVLLAEGERFRQDANITVADVDLDLLRQERVAMGTFHDNRSNSGERTRYRNVQFSVLPPNDDIGFDRTVERFPFVPSDESRLQQDCYEAYNIQVARLLQRLRAIGSQRVMIGISGGLDSTHALIVAAKAMDMLRLPRANILAYTMPGFATGTQSRRQAWALIQALEVTSRELDIRPAATQMVKDMGHPFGQGEPVYDITFENVQAGLRTDYLFRLANHHGGIVIGTGDLSELALGWWHLRRGSNGPLQRKLGG